MESLLGALPHLLKAGTAVAQRSSSSRETARQEQHIRQAQVITASFDPQRLVISSALDRRGLGVQQIEQVMDFLSSDEGREALRILTVATVTDSSYDRKQLVQMVGALLSLYCREEQDWQIAAAKKIVAHCTNAIRELHDQSRRELDAAAFWRSVEHDAHMQLLGSTLLGGKTTEHRIDRLKSLIHDLPTTDFTIQIKEYASTVVDDNENLVIPNVGAVVRTPLDRVYVPPRSRGLDLAELLGSSESHVSRLSSDYYSFLDDEEYDVDLPPDELYNEWADQRHMVVLGDPGAGKSTLAQSLMLHMARNVQHETHARVPFRVVLRHFDRAWGADDSLGFVRHICSGHGEAEVAAVDVSLLRYLLHVSRAAVIFDGLDEILDFERRATIAKRIGQFAKAFPGALVMVTARTVGYADTPIPGFEELLELQPFNSDQVHDFVDKYTATAALSGVDFSVPKFLHETDSISDLRSNPLMLGILCILYGQGRSIPKNRSDLYSKCAEMLFDAWDSRKGTTVLSEYRDLAEQATQAMALAMFESGLEEVSEDWINAFLERFHFRSTQASPAAAWRFAQATLHLWKGRRWLLVFVGSRNDGDYFRFSHRTFLEYFAARQLTYEVDDGVALWKRLRPHVITRTAEPFCLLSVDMASKLRRNTPEEFIEAIALEVDGCGDARLVASLSIFGARALLSCRVSPERKVATYSALLRAMSQLCIPRTTGAELNVQSNSEEPTLLYHMWTDSDSEETANIDDFGQLAYEERERLVRMAVDQTLVADPWFTPVFTHWGEFVHYVARLAEWPEDERTSMIRGLKRAVSSLAEPDLESALLLLYVLRFAPFIDYSWTGNAIDEERTIDTERDSSLSFLRQEASTLWFQLVSDFTEVQMTEVRDLWVRLQLIREGKPGWGDLVSGGTGWGYLVGGKPFEGASDDGYATTAHYIVLACLGMHDSGVYPFFSDDEVDRHLHWLLDNGGVESLQDIRRTNLRYFWSHGHEIQSNREIGSGSTRHAVALLWLTVLFKVEDGHFVDRIMSKLRAHKEYNALVRAFETVLYPGDWNGGPVIDWGGLPPRVAMAIDNVLSLARETPPWSLTK